VGKAGICIPHVPQHQCLSSVQQMTDLHQPLQDQLSSLAEELAKRGVPEDIYDNHSFLQSMELPNPSSHYTELLEEHVSQSVGGRNKTAAAELKQHLQFFLLCLSGCALTHKWLVVSLTKNHYSSDRTLKKYGLKYSPTTHIVSYLKESGLVIAKKGAKYEGHPMRTRIYPTPDFAAQLVSFYLDTVESFDGDYLQFEKDEDREPVDDNNWAKAIKGLPKDHPDKVDINRINDFLQAQQWACKGPVRLKYKQTPFHGGRLYTRYQQLPDRHFKIRINTLINGEPICEADFSANHLRLAMAVLHQQDAGETPYEDLMELSGVNDRSLVKTFVTTAMGASSKQGAQSSWNRRALGAENFVAIEEAVGKRYPELLLFDDWGFQAQNLEGAMLREVMLNGIEKDIVVLPVHDAVAVQQKHESWAMDAMSEAWNKHVGFGRARLKVDRPL